MCVGTRYVLYVCSHRTTEKQSFVSWVCDPHFKGVGPEAPRGEVPSHLANGGGGICAQVLFNTQVQNFCTNSLFLIFSLAVQGSTTERTEEKRL